MSKITNMRKVKQDDKFSLAIREIQSQHPANKKCFDCDQRGPTYVNMTIGSFVCTKCSGMLRGINPPHRIKSISMSSFTSEEVEMVRSKGNAWCAAVWLGNYNRNTNPVDFKDDEKIKEFIVAKYEKRRYYVDPSQANLSGIKQQLTGGSTGSQDSHGSHKLQSSSLIGSTLRSRVDPSSALNQNPSVNSFVVSRPEHVSQTHVSSVGHVPNVMGHVAPRDPIQVPTNGQHVAASVSVPTVPRVNNVANVASKPSDNFANFADFDGAAFDSLPPDPLTAPIVSTTLHPMNRKSSSGSVTAVTANSSGSQQPPAAGGQSQPSAMGQLAAAPAGGLSGSDKYSALAELDDLFRSTTIDSPAAAPPAPTAASQQELGAAVFSSGAKPAVPSAIPSMFMTESPMNQNGTSWGVAAAGTPPAAPWAAGRAASPAAWGGTTAAAPPPSAGKTSPIWAPQWGQPSQDINNLSTGWADSGSKPTSTGLSFPQNTNPFGTSPSNPPLGQMFTDNNNDLFAAAPKPFLSEKPGLNNSGNPWSGSPAASASPFTSSMTPAHNPNNPFL